MTRAVALFIFFLPLVYSFSTNQIFEVNKFTLLLFFAGFAVLFLGNELINLKKWKIIFIIPFLVSVLLSQTPIVSLLGSAERHMGLITFMAILIIFFSVQKIASEKKEEIILSAIMGSGAIIAGYAIVQWVYFPSPDPLFGILDAKSMSYRSFAFLGQPNFLAQAMMIPFFLGLERFHKNIFILISWVSLFSFALYTTDSRAALLGIIVGLLIVFSSWNKIFLWVGVELTTIVWILVAFGENIFSFSERGSSFLARHYFWQDAFSLWLSSIKNFFFGIGPDVLASAWSSTLSYSAFASEYFLMLPDRVHSLPLDLMVQWGLVPSVLLFVFIEKTLIKTENIFFKAALSGLLTMWCFGFFVITDLTMWAILAGIIWGKDSLFFQGKKYLMVTIPLAIFFWILAILTWNADKSFFENNWRGMKNAPYLESNMVQMYDRVSENEKKEIIEMGKKYFFSSRAFQRIIFLDNPSTENFEKWWMSAGNNPLEKLRILLEVKSFGILPIDEYNRLAKTVLAQFPKKEDSSFLSQKVWKYLENEATWSSIRTEIEQLQSTLP